MESPDSRLKSSRTEAAEVGAEESEEEALPGTGAADGAEIREQPSRESSVIRASERKQWKFSHRETGTRNSVSSTFKLELCLKGSPPFPDSSTEPLKGSDSDSRSGSISEDASGDFSPSISFSVVRDIKGLCYTAAFDDVCE